MEPPEIDRLADALAKALYREFRPHARALVESDRSMSDTISKALGAMEVREQEGAQRKQAMLDAAASLAAGISALGAKIDGVTTALALAHHPPPPEPVPDPTPEPDHEPAFPRTTAALDKAGEEGATLLQYAIHAVRSTPGAVRDGVTWAWTHPAEVQDALKRLAVAGGKVAWAWSRVLVFATGILGVIRVVAPHVPWLEPLGALLQALMDTATNFDTGATSEVLP